MDSSFKNTKRSETEDSGNISWIIVAIIALLGLLFFSSKKPKREGSNLILIDENGNKSKMSTVFTDEEIEEALEKYSKSQHAKI